MLRISDHVQTALESIRVHYGAISNEDLVASLADDQFADTTDLTREEIEELIADLSIDEGE